MQQKQLFAADYQPDKDTNTKVCVVDKTYRKYK